MKIYIKVAIAFFAILLGVVVLMKRQSSHRKKEVFHLVNQVAESDVTFHADLVKLFKDIENYSVKSDLSLANKVIISQIKQQLFKSGLKTNETYITLSFSNAIAGSFYAEIIDSIVYKLAFNRLKTFINLEKSESNGNIYYSSSKNISVEEYPNFIKINWGVKAIDNETKKKQKLSSPLYRNLLKSAGSGVINTTGTSILDSNDYATFSYQYDKDLNLEVNWIVTENHPLQKKSKHIYIYPSQKNKIQAYTNVDIEKLQNYINPFLKEKGKELIQSFPTVAKGILELWDGQSSLQIGGKIAKETIQYYTIFDEDFNQIEKKLIKMDSIPDLGFYWGTNQTENTFKLLVEMPNVKLQDRKLQLALLPPLYKHLESHSLRATSNAVEFKKVKSKNILFIKSEIEGLSGNVKIQKTSKRNVRLQLILKDWKGYKKPEKLGISNLW